MTPEELTPEEISKIQEYERIDFRFAMQMQELSIEEYELIAIAAAGKDAKSIVEIKREYDRERRKVATERDRALSKLNAKPRLLG